VNKRFLKQTNSNKLFPSKAIARKIALSKTTHFYFEHNRFCIIEPIRVKRDRTSLGKPCLVPRPHYYARPMRFGSRGPRKFLRPNLTRRSETFCLTWGGAFRSGRAVNNFSALMKDVQQPWRVQRIKPGNPSIFILSTFSLLKVLAFGLSFSFISLN